MKTPTLEEVTEYFKDADKIKSIDFAESKLTGKLSRCDKRGIHFWGNSYWFYDKKKMNIMIWSARDGYAKILSYKEPKEETFLITKDQILELHKNSSCNSKYDIEQLFPEVFETKLTVGEWYKGTFLSGENPLVRIDHVDKRGNIKCYGFDNYTWFDQRGTDGHYGGINELDDWIEATEQEVTEALTKEAVNIFKNTQSIDNSNICSLGGVYKISDKLTYKYWPSNNMFTIDDVCVFKDGVWAIPVIPTLTIPEAEAKLNCKIV